MATLFHPLLYPVLFLAAATAPAADQMPVIPLPDLSAAPVVEVLEATDANTLHVKQRDESKLEVRLADLADTPAESSHRLMARRFLHDLMAGERAWIVQADQSAPAGSPRRWHVYRWPDKLFVNLEMVRQGAADVSPNPAVPPPAAKAFLYWRDKAQANHKGIWQAAAPADAAKAREPAALASAKPAASQPAVRFAADRTVVYVSASGKKYHLPTCKTLRSTKTPIVLEDARKSYEPCKQCKPPR